MINRRTLPAVVVSLLALASCKERKDAPSTGTGRPPELPTAHSHVEIAVTANGFEPAKVAVEKGAPSTLVFTRKTDATCAKEVVFKIDGAPEIRKELRRCQAKSVGGEAREHRPDRVAEVAPQAIHADRRGAPARVGDVADRREQGRVHHRGAERRAARSRGRSRRSLWQRRSGDADRLDPHAAGDQPLAADAVGPRAGDELATPQVAG
jgi:hypothetical protein